ncbi:type II toxin-antitoxin system RelE/ParE family toxin [Pricia sp.]|uniref:type II toxin-antitoxin system RelE/ParE family toxin n=1 Tax=Pricia sp. TaxID=2268138 RepID=UPI003592F24D
MAYRLKILPVALKDLQEAKEWHEKKRIGLGDEFKQAVEFEIDYAGRNPHHFQRRYKELRLSLVKTFSYAIFY